MSWEDQPSLKISQMRDLMFHFGFQEGKLHAAPNHFLYQSKILLQIHFSNNWPRTRTEIHEGPIITSHDVRAHFVSKSFKAMEDVHATFLSLAQETHVGFLLLDQAIYKFIYFLYMHSTSCHRMISTSGTSQIPAEKH